MIKRTTGKKSVAHLARVAGFALVLALLVLSATAVAPVAQDTGGPDQGQEEQAPAAQETEPVLPAEGDETPLPLETEPVIPAEGDEPPVAQDPTDAVLAAGLEARILEQTMLPNAIQTVIEIPVSQDTYIASNKPNQNYGGAHELRVGYDRTPSNDGALRAFMFFDVARYIPSRAVINHARLRGYQYRHEDNSNMLLRGRHLLDSWNENLVTWNSHQPHWGSVTGETWIPPVTGWIEHDLTPLVKEWHNGTHPNHGLFVQGDETPSLGRQRFFYSLNAQNGLYPRLVVDYTVSTDTTPPVATVHLLPAWSPSSFTVSWSGSDTGGSGLAYYDVQYNANGGQWTDWKRQTTHTSALFQGGQNGVNYQFRARAVDHAGNVQVWGATQAQTTVDAIPPTASVQPLPPNTYTQAFHVFWNGSDNVGGSGLASFDVEYRVDHGPWQPLATETTQSSAQFTGGAHDALYEFRARARDQAGNVQSFDQNPQAWTQLRINPPVSRVTPFSPAKTSADSFVVSWQVVEIEPALTVQHYDLRYRFNDEPWQPWLTGTQLTSATFTNLRAQDGVYAFEVRALDSANRLEEFKGEPEATIAVDRLAPFMTPKVWLPAIHR